MDDAPSRDEELTALRRCVRDLAALSALPALWSGSDSIRILESLAEALLGMLRLDFVYVRTAGPREAAQIEVGRVAGRPSTFDVGAMGRALAPWLAEGGPVDRVPALPWCGPGLRGVVVPFGTEGRQGVMAAGKRHRLFPAETDRLLLRVSANQAAVLLGRQQAEVERERLLRVVETERSRLAEVFQRAPSFMCVLSGPDHVFERANDRYLDLVGRRDVIGRPLREALPEVATQGFLELLDRVYATGEPYVGREVPVTLLLGADGTPQQLYLDFVYQALRAEDGRVTGVLVQGVDLTDRKRAEAELRAKDERLNLLFDNMQDYAVVITDPDGTVLEWQGGAERITGYAAHDAVGRTTEFLFVPEDVANGLPSQELAAAGRTGRMEDRRWHLRKDGTRFFADGVTAPLFDEAGRLRGFGKVFRDATAERRAAEELARVTAESERRKRLYETILSNTPDLAYVFDLEHRFTYANDVLLRMWGRTWDDAIGKTCWELGYEPWHAARHDSEIEEVKALKRPVRGEAPFTGTFGPRIYEYIFVPVLGPGGEVEAIAGTTRDVTDRKRSEEELARLLKAEQRRAALLARVAQASRLLNAVLSVDGIATLLTEEARSIIGAHQAVTSLTVDDNWAQAINAISLSDRYGAYRGFDAKPTGEGIYAEVCRRNLPMRLTQQALESHPAWKGFGQHRDRHPPMRGWLAVPLVGHGGRNLGLVQLSDKYEGDFTEEDEAVLVQLAAIASVGIENARLYDSLREQDRRKDEFLATLAHELRNPLAPVRSGLEVLRLTGSLAGTAARTAAVMDRQLSHMVRLVDDLMDVSRVTRGKVTLSPERVSLRAVCDLALETSRPLIEASRHALEVELPDEPLATNADITRLAQVLSNLLNNAAKYTPEGGRICLRGSREGDEVVIEISDTGVGIPRDMLERVFDMFTQVGRSVERAQGGLGIGLSLARRLVEMHGGSLKADSDGPGRGARFTVRLPAAAEEAAPAEGGRPGRAALAGGGLRVLVVDDNADAADTLALFLQMSGCVTRVARSGTEALDSAGTFRPEVVFLDIGLPGMSGYDVASRLRADPELGACLLVAVTGWGSEEDRRRSRQAGFDAHLTKPVDADTLVSLLSRVVPRAAASPAA